MSDVDFSALNRFSYRAQDDANSIANLDSDNDGSIKQAGTYKGALRSVLRSSSEKASNNAIRTELLKSLGQAFHIEGMNDQGDGKVTFNKQFMDSLGKLFGAELKKEDFGIAADGSVASGKPLTNRRITAILQKAATYVDASQAFSPSAYFEKTKAFIEQFGKLGDKRTEAGEKLAKTLEAASKALCMLDKPSPLDPRRKIVLLDFNRWHDPENANKGWHRQKWDVHFVNQDGMPELQRTNTDEGLQKVLRGSGLDIDLGLASLDGLGTDRKSIKAFNRDYQQKLQSLVKTTCDAWDKVQQGQIPVDKFLEAFNADSGQGQTLAAFLGNMQALEAAG